MTADGDGRPAGGGAHRAPQDPLWTRSLLRSVAGGLLAIALVGGGIYALNRGTERPFAGSPAVERPSGEPSQAEISADATAAPTTAAPTTAPPTTPPPTTAPAPPAAAPRPTATPVARLPLTVLNSSRRTKLAARAAEQFRRRGWPIRQVGNYRARVRITTVYYLPGQLAAARRLQREFPAVRRVLPRPPRMPGEGLTVVVTREYPA